MKQSDVNPKIVADLWKQHRDAAKVSAICGLDPGSVGKVVARLRAQGMSLPLSHKQELEQERISKLRLKADADRVPFSTIAMEALHHPGPPLLDPPLGAAKVMMRLVDGCRALPDEGLTPQAAAVRELANVIYMLCTPVSR